jgi:hypothetical protein
MASTYSTNLALELIGTGEQSGTWGTTTNTNLGTLIEQAVSGYVTQAITDGADTVITIPNGTTGVARNMAIEMTGALTAARNLIVPSNRKLYFIYNNTTGGYAVTVKVSGLTGVSVPNGAKIVLVSNGTDIVSAQNYLTSVTLGSALPVTSGGLGVTTVAANGQIPIGNGSGYTVANITAGSGISVTNASGSITIASTVTGTVTSVGGTGTVSGITLTGAVTTSGNLTLGGTLSVDLTTSVTGTLPVANGGTGVTVSTGSGSNVLSTSPTLVTPVLGTPTSGNLSNCTADGTNVIGYLNIPQNAQSSNYTFANTDRGKHVYSTNSGAQTVTVPTNASVSIDVGAAITIVNNGTTAITFTTTGTTVYKAGTSAAWASGGTLAVRGLCTWLKVATDTWFVSGTGLS